MKAFKTFLTEANKIYNYEDKLDLTDGTMFVAVKRQHTMGKTDPIMMYIVDDKFNVIKKIGTHSSVQGAMKYGRHNYKTMIKESLDESKFSRLEFEVASEDVSKISDAIKKFTAKNKIDVSMSKSVTADKTKVGITVPADSHKALMLAIEMKLSKYKAWVDGKPAHRK